MIWVIIRKVRGAQAHGRGILSREEGKSGKTSQRTDLSSETPKVTGQLCMSGVGRGGELAEWGKEWHKHRNIMCQGPEVRHLSSVEESGEFQLGGLNLKVRGKRDSGERLFCGLVAINSIFY